MKNLLFCLFLLCMSFSCAKKQNEESYVRCQVYFEFVDNTRVNAFWDIDRQVKVDVSTCDEVLPTDSVTAQ